MNESFDRPQTPREFALMDRIKFLEHLIREKRYSVNFETAPYIDDMISLPANHKPVMQVANLRASNISGTWKIGCRGITEVPGEYYEISEYCDAPESLGFASSSLLTDIHQKFIQKLGCHLVDKYGKLWSKYDNKGS
jgi:hypothetical protein